MDCVILAAGKGTRMNSSVPKVLHGIGGKTLIEHLLGSLDPLELKSIVAVIGYKENLVRNSLSNWEVEFTVQKEQKGTAHALQQAKSKIESDSFLVVPGDLPLVKTSSLQQFIDFASDKEANISLLTVKRNDPSGYGRIKRDESGKVQAIIEDQDATEQEKQIKEVNAGLYLMSNREELWRELEAIDPSNAQGEFYLTDLIKKFADIAGGIEAFQVEKSQEFLGVNTRKDLVLAGKVLNRRKINSLFDSGVTVIDPGSTLIEGSVNIGKDTVIEPFTVLRGETSIGSDARIGPNVEIVDSYIGSEANISYSVVKSARVGDSRKVEPFSFIGPN